MTVMMKFGVPLFISEILLIFTLYPDETFDTLFGDNEFLREIFESESESEQTFGSTNIAHAIHSHGDIANNNFDDNNLRRRISMLADSF
ncbi:unnamed protein product [Onchocerca flexuosa]|uniref:Secreted protein n=1 Tax=Onchocerca flexuosa TaxID=387005 RepID=A0A183HU91_9BILA|nr:unnamed protein product [Onchocerca flexuosa]